MVLTSDVCGKFAVIIGYILVISHMNKTSYALGEICI